jgi:hypothetical protein
MQSTVSNGFETGPDCLFNSAQPGYRYRDDVGKRQGFCAVDKLLIQQEDVKRLMRFLLSIARRGPRTGIQPLEKSMLQATAIIIILGDNGSSAGVQASL